MKEETFFKVKALLLFVLLYALAEAASWAMAKAVSPYETCWDRGEYGDELADWDE